MTAKRCLAYLAERLDDVGHRLGWSPKWLCDLNEYLITGERQPR